MSYIVQAGETLEMIAEKLFGDKSMVQYLASINSLPSVPSRDGESFVYLVSPGQELNVGIAEIEGKKFPWVWIISGSAALALVWLAYKKYIS